MEEIARTTSQKASDSVTLSSVLPNTNAVVSARDTPRRFPEHSLFA